MKQLTLLAVVLCLGCETPASERMHSSAYVLGKTQAQCSVICEEASGEWISETGPCLFDQVATVGVGFTDGVATGHAMMWSDDGTAGAKAVKEIIKIAGPQDDVVRDGDGCLVHYWFDVEGYDFTVAVCSDKTVAMVEVG